MQICPKCSKEMVCKKNGVYVVWRETHARAGDKFGCEGCGSEVVVCNSTAFPLTKLAYDAAKATGEVVDMEG